MGGGAAARLGTVLVFVVLVQFFKVQVQLLSFVFNLGLCWFLWFLVQFFKVQVTVTPVLALLD